MFPTRCKFHCSSATPADQPGPYVATLTAVVDGSEENKAFFAATPSGSLSLSVMAHQPFVSGKCYYIDINEAPEAAAAPAADETTAELKENPPAAA